MEVASSSLVARSRQKQDIQFGCPVFSLDEENALPPPVRGAHIQSEVRQGSCELPQVIRGMPGSEFEPRSPLQDVLMKDATQKTPHESAVFLYLYWLFSGGKVRKNVFFGKSVFPRERRHFRDAAEHSCGLV